jgi:predicted dehydrogenase
MFRVGLIGFGYAGRTFHAPLVAATPGLTLAAVASSDAGRVRSVYPDVEVDSIEALIARADIDLVIIATPNDTHQPLAMAALQAGRHVVVDKPFALSAAEARELVDAAAAKRRVLSVFHNRRWDDDFLTLARVLREGRLGRVVEVVSHFDRFRPQVRARWREAAVPGAGLWMDLGPHVVDQALVLFGRPSAIRLDQAVLRDGAVVDDWFDAQLRWEEGAHGGLRMRLHASTLAAAPGPRFAVHGTRGSFVVHGLDEQEDQLKAGMLPGSLGWGRSTRRAVLHEEVDGALRQTELALESGDYLAYYRGVAAALQGKEPPVPAVQALQVQQVLDAGRRSAQERAELPLELG